MPKKRIWTPAARQFLFEQLMDRFGPGSEWEATNNPGKANEQAYEEFCELFAKIVGAKSGEAVKLQIRFGMPAAGESNWETGQAQTAILCLAASLEAGFIRDGDLPKLRAAAHKNSN